MAAEESEYFNPHSGRKIKKYGPTFSSLIQKEGFTRSMLLKKPLKTNNRSCSIEVSRKRHRSTSKTHVKIDIVLANNQKHKYVNRVSKKPAWKKQSLKKTKHVKFSRPISTIIGYI